MTASVEAPRRAPFLRVARAAWVVVLVAGAAWLVWSRRRQLSDLLDGARPAFLVLAFALGFLQLQLNARFWTAALRALGVTVTLADVQRASARSVLGRYLPGSIWYQVGRSALLARQGVGRAELATVAVLDTALGVVVGGAFGGALLLGSGGSLPGLAALTLWCAVLVALCSPPVVNAVLVLVARRTDNMASRLGWQPFVGLLGRLALFWVGAAAAFLSYLHAFPEVELPSLVQTAGSFMVAWVIGFLALFAPQGLGVFEAAFATAMTDGRVASVAVLVGGYRALLLVRDVVAWSWAELASRPAGRR